MYEIETALLYFQDGTKQFTDQRETSLCVTFVGMFLLREALYKFLLDRVTDTRKQKEIKDILFSRLGKMSLPKWSIALLTHHCVQAVKNHDIFHIKTSKKSESRGKISS